MFKVKIKYTILKSIFSEMGNNGNFDHTECSADDSEIFKYFERIEDAHAFLDSYPSIIEIEKGRNQCNKL